MIDYDLVVIGGGINGTGIAATAALRGLKVLLCEQNDLASGTSSASSKLIHGGLRYLESYEFGLVAESLAEREKLQTLAKHLVKPQAFIIPHHASMRPRLIIRLGLFIYDLLAKNSHLPKTKSINLRSHVEGMPLKSDYKFGFRYYDCKTNDARLVIATAQKARALGAQIATQTEFMSAQAKGDHWSITLHDRIRNYTYDIAAKGIVNAAGPWVHSVLFDKLNIPSKHHLTLTKGSHIVLPKFYEGEHAYLLQTNDKRVVFVIPYLKKFLLVGTTDLFYDEPTINPRISEAEIIYLLQQVGHYFGQMFAPSDIVHTYSGIRPLLQDHHRNPSAVTRGYYIELTQTSPLLVTIFGGKLTTFRSLSEKTLALLEPYFPQMMPYNIKDFVLPGSQFSDYSTLATNLQEAFPWLPNEILQRYLDSYGTLTTELLASCHAIEDLGMDFGAYLYQREVDYLLDAEWALTSEDILWRRTKLGYIFPPGNIPRLDEYLKKAVKK